MGYYDGDFEELYGDYEDNVEPINLIAEPFSEREVTDILESIGLISGKAPRLNCDMEKLVFVYGNPNEVYSPVEIRFTESVENILVYPDFFFSLNKGRMACRVIAAKINACSYEALNACVSFEKIVDKALDGFNIFFFVTEESVFWGCKVFDKTGKRDCALSKPLKTQEELDEFLENMTFIDKSHNFMDLYDQFWRGIVCEKTLDDYETRIVKRRGIQFSYIDKIDQIGKDVGVDMILEKERYRHMFESEEDISFDSLFEEVEESLSFIKSNRINTYELLFEAEETMRQVDKIEDEDDKLARKTTTDNSASERKKDSELEALLDDPEEMIKLLMKWRKT